MREAGVNVTPRPLTQGGVFPMSPHTSTPERFWTKVNFAGPVPEHRPELGPCWLWTGCTDRYGYGKFGTHREVGSAHRYAYEFCVNPIPDGLQIDHLCRTRPCQNPDHMELVTSRVNTLRGEGITAQKARQTHCIRGHEFNEENMYIHGRGYRKCRACARQWHQQHLRAGRVS